MKHLKKLIHKKAYSEIISYISSVHDTNTLKQIIDLLKIEEVFINRYTDVDVANYLSVLSQHDLLLKHYTEEVECVNILFRQERKMQSFIKKINKRKRLSNVLYELDCIYSHFIKERQDLQPREYDQQDVHVFLEGLALLYNNTFKSLLYDTDIYQDGAFLFSAFDYLPNSFTLNECAKYIQFSTISYKWHMIFEDWKKGFVSIYKQEDTIITRYISSTELAWFKNSKSKLQIYRDIDEAVMANAVSMNPSYFSKELSEFDEIIAWVNIREYLHTNDIFELVNDIPIKYWIKSYTAIIKYAKKHGEHNLSVFRALLGNLFFVKAKEDWIALFVKEGIPEADANKLFVQLTYTKSSTDIYDYPFIKIKDKYMITPALFTVAHGGKILRSRLSRNNIDISEKGKNFENIIRKLIKKRYIPTIQIHRRNNGQDYECDIAFVMDNTLFLCECKDNGDKYIYNYLADFYVKDIEQSKRIGDFFENNIEIVVDEFKKAGYHDIKIDRIEKLLIYNTVFHSVFNIDGVCVVDYERFSSFFRRGDLDKRICEFYNGPIECLSGSFTYNKFILYINTQMNVCHYSDIIDIQTQTLDFGDITLIAEFERCNNIDREEMLCILDPWYAKKKSLLEGFKG